MKRIALPLTLSALLTGAPVATAQDDPADVTRDPMAAFADEDGDGVHDRAPDHDGDGIVNHEDPDSMPMGPGHGRARLVDADGDGVPDRVRSYRSGGRMFRGRGAMARGWPGGGFADEDGDGIRDDAPDRDGDGIVDRLDEDHTPRWRGHRGMRGRARAR